MKPLEVIVCSSCGHESCAAGDLFCEDYRTASMVPRWRWERLEAIRRLAVLNPSVTQDDSLLHAVRVAELEVHAARGIQREHHVGNVDPEHGGPDDDAVLALADRTLAALERSES